VKVERWTLNVRLRKLTLNVHVQRSLREMSGRHSHAHYLPLPHETCSRAAVSLTMLVTKDEFADAALVWWAMARR